MYPMATKVWAVSLCIAHGDSDAWLFFSIFCFCWYILRMHLEHHYTCIHMKGMVLLWYWSHIASIGWKSGGTPTWEILCIVWCEHLPNQSFPVYLRKESHGYILTAHQLATRCRVPAGCGTRVQMVQSHKGALAMTAMTCSAILVCFFRCSAPGRGYGHVDLCCWTTSDEKRGHVHPIDQLTRLDLGRPAWNDSNSPFCDLFMFMAPRSVGKTGFRGRKARLLVDLQSYHWHLHCFDWAFKGPWAWEKMSSSCQAWWNANWASAACLRTCAAQAGGNMQWGNRTGSRHLERLSSLSYTFLLV